MVQEQDSPRIDVTRGSHFLLLHCDSYGKVSNNMEWFLTMCGEDFFTK